MQQLLKQLYSKTKAQMIDLAEKNTFVGSLKDKQERQFLRLD